VGISELCTKDSSAISEMYVRKLSPCKYIIDKPLHVYSYSLAVFIVDVYE
jgi:hypothetical protein